MIRLSDEYTEPPAFPSGASMLTYRELIDIAWEKGNVWVLTAPEVDDVNFQAARFQGDIVPVIWYPEGEFVAQNAPQEEQSLWDLHVSPPVATTFFHELGHALKWIEEGKPKHPSSTESADTVYVEYEADAWNRAKELSDEYGVPYAEESAERFLSTYDRPHMLPIGESFYATRKVSGSHVSPSGWIR